MKNWAQASLTHAVRDLASAITIGDGDWQRSWSEAEHGIPAVVRELWDTRRNMSDLKTTPIDEGTTVPGHIVALAHGYLAAYDEPIPTDPGSVGGRLPTDLMDLWQNGKDGMTEAEPLGEGNEKTVAAIMIAAKRLGLVPSACSFSNELRDWVTHAGYVPTTVGVVVAGDTYRLVTGQQ